MAQLTQNVTAFDLQRANVFDYARLENEIVRGWKNFKKKNGIEPEIIFAGSYARRLLLCLPFEKRRILSDFNSYSALTFKQRVGILFNGIRRKTSDFLFKCARFRFASLKITTGHELNVLLNDSPVVFDKTICRDQLVFWAQTE